MIWIVLCIVLFAVLFVLFWDFLPIFKNWLGRIKIGSLTDEKEWQRRAKTVVVDWLRNGAPRVPKNENKRLRLFDDIKNIGEKNQIDCWQDAALVKAATASGGNSMSENIDRFLKRYIDTDSGKWNFNPDEARIDYAMLAYELLCSPYVDNFAIKPAMDFTAERLKKSYEIHGSIPYNENAANVRFVDTVGMACPFLIKYATVYDEPEYIDIAVKQIKEYEKFGIHSELKLPAHCFNSDSKAPLGIYGWARGCAWWTLGLVDSLNSILDAVGHNSDKVYLLRTALDAVYTAKDYVSTDGSVGRILTVSSAQDSSAAAMLAYCFKSMGKLTNDSSLTEAAEKILAHLRTATRRNGVVDYSQGDTRGIGFYSDSLCVMPAAQGFAVAAAEI